MRGPSARGAEPVRGPADPLKIHLEGRTEPRTQLGEGGTEGAGQGLLFLRHRGRSSLKDPVWGTGGDGTEDMGGMKVLDGGLETIGEENTIGEVWGNGGEETGLESVADTTGTRGTSGE